MRCLTSCCLILTLITFLPAKGQFGEYSHNNWIVPIHLVTTGEIGPFVESGIGYGIIENGRHTPPLGSLTGQLTVGANPFRGHVYLLNSIAAQFDYFILSTKLGISSCTDFTQYDMAVTPEAGLGLFMFSVRFGGNIRIASSKEILPSWRLSFSYLIELKSTRPKS